MPKPLSSYLFLFACLTAQAGAKTNPKEEESKPTQTTQTVEKKKNRYKTRVAAGIIILLVSLLFLKHILLDGNQWVGEEECLVCMGDQHDFNGLFGVPKIQCSHAHLLCQKCYNELYKSRNENTTDEEALPCPVCGEPLKPNPLYQFTLRGKTPPDTTKERTTPPGPHDSEEPTISS